MQRKSVTIEGRLLARAAEDEAKEPIPQ